VGKKERKKFRQKILDPEGKKIPVKKKISFWGGEGVLSGGKKKNNKQQQQFQGEDK